MAIVNKHDVERSVSLFKILSILCIAGFIGWSVWAIVIKPVVSPIKTTTQKAAQIVNPAYAPKIYPGGCASIRVNEYYKEKK